jgi:molybdopterin-containing oxidoreductase family iron-sulfur binding subunit
MQQKMTRRQVVQKIAAITAAGAGAGVLFPSQSLAFTKLIERIIQTEFKTKYEVLPPLPRVNFGMAIDLGLCIGCRRCSYACKRENSVPDSISPPYIMLMEVDPITLRRGGSILDEHENGMKNRLMYTKLRKDKEYMPLQCNHCEAPPCAKVCPTTATYKDEDGIVMIDYNKCIGCRYCMVACPYNARRFNWAEPKVAAEDINPLVPLRYHGVVEKCTFCVHRTRRGRTTRCVEACPNKARVFGDLNDPESKISKLLENEKSFRLKESLNTEPQIWYLTETKKKPMRWYKPLPPPKHIRGLS